MTRHRRAAALLLPLAMLCLPAAPSAGQDTRRWYQRVLGDLDHFDRPILDARAESHEDEKPLLQNGRVFCPHTDGSPLRTHAVLRATGRRPDDRVLLRLYYCEIDSVYWTHALGGPRGLNLVTGPYRMGVGPVTSRPATQPAAIRPKREHLRVRIEKTAEVYRAGQPVALKIVLENAGPFPFWVNVNPALLDLRYRVHGPRVVVQPLSAVPVVSPTRREDFALLKPGGRRRVAVEDLRGTQFRHRLLDPGGYAVQVTYANRHDGSDVGVTAWTGEAASKGIIVTVAGQVP